MNVLQNICGFMFRWEMIDYMLPCGPRGRRKATGRHPWIPKGAWYIYLRKSEKIIAGYPVVYRPVPGRVPCATRRAFHMLFTGYRFDENAGRNGSSLFDTPAPGRVGKIVSAPVKSEGSRSRAVEHRAKMGKISIFTRRTGPGNALWKPLQGAFTNRSRGPYGE